METLNPEQRLKVEHYAEMINEAFEEHKSIRIITNQFSGLEETVSSPFIRPSYYYTAEFEPMERVHNGVCSGRFCKCGKCRNLVIDLKLKKIRYLNLL